jgi:hypothetical protein
MTPHARPAPSRSIRVSWSALALAILWIGAGFGTLPATAQETEAKPPSPTVTVEAILVSPENPAPDTLCRLAVRLKNHGDRSVSGFGFRISVNGTDLPVYKNQRYLEEMKPGASREISLFNFWSSETLRPAAKDGALSVEVELIEARWVDYKVEEEIPTWTLLEEVPTLPPSRKVSKPFKEAPSK